MDSKNPFTLISGGWNGIWTSGMINVVKFKNINPSGYTDYDKIYESCSRVDSFVYRDVWQPSSSARLITNLWSVFKNRSCGRKLTFCSINFTKVRVLQDSCNDKIGDEIFKSENLNMIYTHAQKLLTPIYDHTWARVSSGLISSWIQFKRSDHDFFWLHYVELFLCYHE